MRAFLGLAAVLLILFSCQTPQPPDLVTEGRNLFFNETFDGNGRTCGTCHRAEENFTLSPAFIAALPDTDPLFVAERNPALERNFENPRLMREFGLILENQDGFDDLPNDFNIRGIPHTLALRNSIDSLAGPMTGWGGDGAPDDRSLRSFATGAVRQHFTKRLERLPGIDFRLPTEHELDALEAFQLSLGRQEDLALPLLLKGTTARRGQEIFLDNTLGKCNACHFNAGANVDPALFGEGSGNLNFDTGVENLPDQPADLTGELVPPDDGFEDEGTFNIPPLVEAADTGPFFHNNSVETIEGAVATYNGAAFNTSPAGQLIAGATGSGIILDGTQVVEVAAFLRVINALENIRSAIAFLQQDVFYGEQSALNLARAEIEDAINVLAGGGLHPQAVILLNKADSLAKKAEYSYFGKGQLRKKARAKLREARGQLVDDR